MSSAGYQIFSLAESARVKGMWAGALERACIPGLSGVYPAESGAAPRYEIREIRRDHTPALLKIIDEGVVNAADHKKEHERGPPAGRVSRISLEFTPANGEFVIENDGPGIPIILHEEATAAAGYDVFVPEVAFAMFLAGRNMDKPPDSVKGGVNGIGAKLINVHSSLFTVETVAADSDGVPVCYAQTFRNRMRVRGVPEISPARAPRPHTRIAFIPAYAELGYGADPAGPLAAQDAADLEAWCRWRMFLWAAFVGP